MWLALGTWLVMATGMAHAQVAPLPSFAGTWTPVSSEAAAESLVVTQSATRLTYRAGDAPAIEVTLDGSVTRQREENTEATATWTAGTLTIVLAITPEFGDTSLQKQTWRLDPSGQLVIETTQDRRGQTRVVRVVYRKA